MANEIRCNHCGHWNSDDLLACQSCSENMSRNISKSHNEHVIQAEPFKINMPKLEVHESDNPLLKGLKHFVNGLQWIAMLIGSAFAWMAYWIAV